MLLPITPCLAYVAASWFAGTLQHCSTESQCTCKCKGWCRCNIRVCWLTVSSSCLHWGIVLFGMWLCICLCRAPCWCPICSCKGKPHQNTKGKPRLQYQVCKITSLHQRTVAITFLVSSVQHDRCSTLVGPVGGVVV